MLRKELLAMLWPLLLTYPAAEALAGNYKVLSLTSSGPIPVTQTPGLSARLFGTIVFRWYTDAGCTIQGTYPAPASRKIYVKFDIVGNQGLILSNGDLPTNLPPMHTFPAENFYIPAGGTSCIATNTNRAGIFPLSMSLRSDAGSLLSFNGSSSLSGTYTYTGPVFDAHGGTIRAPRAAIPEPATLGLMLAGTGGLMLALRRRRKSA